MLQCSSSTACSFPLKESQAKASQLISTQEAMRNCPTTASCADREASGKQASHALMPRKDHKDSAKTQISCRQALPAWPLGRHSRWLGCHSRASLLHSSPVFEKLTIRQGRRDMLWKEDSSETTSISKMRTKEPRTLREKRSCGAVILGGHRTRKEKSEFRALQLFSTSPSPGPYLLALADGALYPPSFATDSREHPSSRGLL